MHSPGAFVTKKFQSLKRPVIVPFRKIGHEAARDYYIIESRPAGLPKAPSPFKSPYMGEDQTAG